MASVKDEIKNIIEQLTALQTKPKLHRDVDDDFPIPRMIDAGNGGSIIVSRAIDDSIGKVANELLISEPTLVRRFTQAEWRSSVRRVFGPALAIIDLDDDPAANADVVLEEIKAALGKEISSNGAREFAFGCTLFGNSDIKPFVIGPVQFEPRLSWLLRKRDAGAVSAITHRRVKKAWSGVRLSKRKTSRDSIVETDILDAIGSCSFVCSVETKGLAPEAGREKALTAARLAITAIAVLWQTPSRALEGMNLLFDRRPHRQKALSYVPGKVILAGSRWSHSPHGPHLKTGKWEEMFSECSNYFSVVADILAHVVDPTGAAVRPKMMNTLTQALLWFHEGSRETVTLMAIVKYSAALDALACGRKSGGIRRLINARLGLQDSTPIRADGPTLKQAVDEIYSDGRSRTIHGTNEKLGHDWSGTKGLAEQFARLSLLFCIDWVAMNPGSDDPRQLQQ